MSFDIVELPVCGYRQVARHTPEGARAVCREAILGKGKAVIDLAYPENRPITVETKTTLFNNGLRDGEIRLLLHSRIEVPVPRAAIARIGLRPAPPRNPGWIATVDVPRIGDGHGTLLEFALALGRRFSDDAGRSHSFVSARCPDGKFELEMSKAVFKNEANTPAVPSTTILKARLLVPCKRGR
ncbi:MAG TPA: hypothetical protein VEQ41_04135 [Solirubrobacterales bacterium]|nr:hypothetical protein [Solirubrobacterales bacterium]